MKDYYSLKEIEKLTELKYRQLQNRILAVQEKYKNDKTKIYKHKNRWYIHDSILFEFERKRKPINYKRFTTISCKSNYEINYWRIVMKDIDNQIYKNLDKYNRTRYVIELNENGIYHLHFLTTFNNKKLLKKLIKGNIYIKDNDMNILIEDVYDVIGLHRYFRKQNKPTLIKRKFAS